VPPDSSAGIGDDVQGGIGWRIGIIGKLSFSRQQKQPMALVTAYSCYQVTVAIFLAADAAGRLAPPATNPGLAAGVHWHARYKRYKSGIKRHRDDTERT
jgi:hypothetical protein